MPRLRARVLRRQSCVHVFTDWGSPVMLSLELDRDLCGHLITALGRHRAVLQNRGLAEPPALIALQAAVKSAVDSDEPRRLSITGNQEQSLAISRPGVVEDAIHERDFLSRNDVAQIAGIGIATVDRWVASGRLSSQKVGRIRRIRRSDLERLLDRAA